VRRLARAARAERVAGYDDAVASAFLVLAVLLGQGAQDEPPFELRVNRAIARGVAYLKGQQRPDGGFPGHESQHPGGATALVAFTLVKSGVRRNDEALQRALRSLEGHAMQSTYSAAVHLLLCAAVGDEPRKRDAAASLAFLVEHQVDGIWAYPWDHECCSNTQFALLGLRAARQLGLEPPEKTLVAVAEGVWHFQDRDGAFHYDLERMPYDGIHAAALSGLAILDEFAERSPAVKAALRKHERDRQRAEAWLEAHFAIERNSYATGAWTPYFQYAYLWAIERWCGLTERKTVAGQDWYRRGAEWLIATQAADGSWTSDDKALTNTCFALLFLRRATITAGEELADIYERIDAESRQREPYDRRPPPAAVRLTDWLLAGPWQGKPDHHSIVDLPFDPKQVKAKEGAKLAKRDWQRVTLLADRWTNLDELTTNDGDHRLWALAATISWSGATPIEPVLWLELEDGWDVYLDGARVSFERRVSSAIDGDVRIPLSITPGAHVLLVLISDDGGAAAFGARLSAGDDGAPPPGLEIGVGERTKSRH
jgi:hypothetical protein